MFPLTNRVILKLAEAVAWTRPLEFFPGWRFGIEEKPEPKGKLKFRLAIWDYCNRRQLQKSIIMNWHHGTRVNVYLGNDLSRCLFVAGCIDPNEFAFLDGVMDPGMIFVDVGANEGLYSVFAAKRAETVLAIEPSRREFERLRANLELNNLTNVRARKLALSNQNGEAVLHISGYEHEGQNTFGEFPYFGVELSYKETVPLKRLDDLLEDERLKKVDIIKLDIEGAEFLALDGSSNTLRTSRPLLLLELFDGALRRQGSSSAEVIRLLKSFDYEIYVFDQDSGRPVKSERYSEVSENIVAAPRERRWRGLNDN
ncbi:MAG: hypothetical protein C5B44_04675 [Acidobacteria bacterium]|nr:MAG: hypothetical protein C5B44_04675 [Acidobacteriota bacterium]